MPNPLGINGAHSTRKKPEFPMPIKEEHFLLTVRERLARNLLQEALSGQSPKSQIIPDIEKAKTAHEHHRLILDQFLATHSLESKNGS